MTSDIFRPLILILINYLSTMSEDFYLIASEIWSLFWTPLELNYRKQVFYLALKFLPWEFLFVKKLDFEKTKTTQYTTFKTDIIKVILVFRFPTFLLTKIRDFRESDHAFKTSANFSRFLTPTPLPSAVFYYYLSANLANF